MSILPVPVEPPFSRDQGAMPGLPIAQAGEGEPPPPSLDALIGMLTGRIAESSKDVYRRRVRGYLTFCRARGLDPGHYRSLAEWRDHLITETAQSPNTINLSLAAVRRAIHEAEGCGLLDPVMVALFERVEGASVTAMASRLKPHAQVWLTPEEMEAIYAVPDRADLIGCRDAALILTLGSSGVRNFELTQIKVGHLYERDGGSFVLIMAGKGKREAAPREALLSERAYQACQQWLARRRAEGVVSEWLFTGFSKWERIPLCTPLTTQAVRKIVHKLVGRAGFPEEAEANFLKPHDVRRTFITRIAEEHGADWAQQAAGHATVTTTIDRYIRHRLRPGMSNAF